MTDPRHAPTAMPARANTTTVGDVSEAACRLWFIEAGLTVLLPTSTNQPYDMVVDVEGRFRRVQCKNGRVRGGVIIANAASVTPNGRTYYTAEDIDFYAVWVPELRELYVLPVRDVGSEIRMRVSPTRNGQSHGIRWADQYRFDPRNGGAALLADTTTRRPRGGEAGRAGTG